MHSSSQYWMQHNNMETILAMHPPTPSWWCGIDGRNATTQVSKSSLSQLKSTHSTSHHQCVMLHEIRFLSISVNHNNCNPTLGFHPEQFNSSFDLGWLDVCDLLALRLVSHKTQSWVDTVIWKHEKNIFTLSLDRNKKPRSIHGRTTTECLCDSLPK
jgi:hypothetical protein